MGATIVTGASSGIGRDLALELARRGEPVALLARRREPMEEVAALIRSRGGEALVCECDVTDPSAVRLAFENAASTFGSISRVIANAGGGRRISARSLRTEDVSSMLAVNVLGVANCVEAALPYLLRQGHGHLVFMGSLAGMIGLPGSAGYSAAKAAVGRLAESLRIELKPDGIDVTLLLPGFVRTHDRRRKRPFEMPIDEAVFKMADAIIARRRAYRFPWPLVMLLAFSMIVPPVIRDSLLRRMGKSR